VIQGEWQLREKIETQLFLKRHHLPGINPSVTIERRMVDFGVDCGRWLDSEVLVDFLTFRKVLVNAIGIIENLPNVPVIFQ